MAEYLVIENENNKVIVDDKYPTPKLLCRTTVYIDTVLPKPSNINEVRFLRVYWDYKGSTLIKSAYSLREMGFDYDDSDESITKIINGIMAFGRSISNEFFTVSCYISKDANGVYRFFATANGMSKVPVEVALYAIDAKLMPSKLGLHAFDVSGNLIFDAMRGNMHNIGILEGSLNMGNSIARTYTIPTPSGLDPNNIFISFRSNNPYYAGFVYSASGVRMDDSFYAPSMRTTANSVIVDLKRFDSVGRSTSYSFGGYFENVIYVPQKQGVYL